MYELVLLANLLLWAALVFHFTTLPNASAFHPAAYYLFFHGLVFTVRPIIADFRLYEAIYLNYGFFPSADDKITVILAAMLGLVAFYAACVRTGNAMLQFRHDRITELERSQLLKPFLFVLVLLGPFAVWSALDNWQVRAFDAGTMVTDAATGSTINTTGNGYWSDLQLALAPLTVMLVWFCRFRWWSFLPLLGFVVLRAGTGGRWPFLMACAAVGLMFLFERRRALPRFKELLVPLLALILFQTVGEDRGASIRSLFVEDRSLAGVYGAGEVRFMEGMDFANMEYFEYVVYAVPQRTGTYNYFLDNLQVFTEPVPRVLWPGKPVGQPIRLFSLWDYGRPIGMTFSLPGNGWLQLGYLGVAIWCGLFGWLYGRFYNWFQNSNQSTLKTMAYLLLLPISVQVFRDGVLLTLIKTHAWFLLPIGLTLWFARMSAVPMLEDLRLMAYRAAARRGGGAVPERGAPSLRSRRAAASPRRAPAE